jgi:hypothetical protein
VSVPEYRCAECGVRRGVGATFRDGRIEHTIYQCDAHPDGIVLRWDSIHQSAAIWCEQYAIGRTWADVLDAIHEALPGTRKRALLLVAPLLEMWGGLPERRQTQTIVPGRNPLFDPSPRERVKK